MTKARAPLSIEAAIVRIAGIFDDGFAGLARIAEREARTVRNWSDPDTPEEIPVGRAIALDLAYIEAGGAGAPIFEAYALQLELAEAEQFADRLELLRHAQSVVRETGDANAAIIGAAQPTAGDAERARALAEVAEAIEALRNAIPLLGPLPSSAVAVPGADRPP
ncbi:MAG TPA: hypothetical protein PKD99_02410 [Sphingopyxis sp.]|nr:hypothetical protein [Sphingopyxis sp.]HMP43930.1 hypothetical protein [Sphingopyxis sp.]HMQ18097.1 hypothetical protein [Sphingopyxis sp.]